MRLRSKLKRWTVALLLVSGLWAADKPTVIKDAPVKPAWATTGKELFTNYCSVCHGSDGKGAGPASNSLIVAPADLTILSRKNGGKFPSAHVINVLRGEADLPAHATKEMPVWAPAFSTSEGSPAGGQQRIGKLLKFLESLQVK